MDKTTKIVLGVAGVAAVGVAVWYFASQQKAAVQPVYRTVAPPQTNAQQTAAEITAAAAAANAAANLVSSASDALATSDDSTGVYESTLSGMGGLYGRN